MDRRQKRRELTLTVYYFIDEHTYSGNLKFIDQVRCESSSVRRS
jgi:hypothetical protein